MISVEYMVVVPSTTVLPRMVESRPIDLVSVACKGCLGSGTSLVVANTTKGLFLVGEVPETAGSIAVACDTEGAMVLDTTLVIVSRRLLTIVWSPM